MVPVVLFFFSSRRRHTRCGRDWSSDVCSSDLDLNLTDMETCYKLVRADLMKRLPLRSNRFGFEVEITARLAQAGAPDWVGPPCLSGRTHPQGQKITLGACRAPRPPTSRSNLLPPRGRC